MQLPRFSDVLQRQFLAMQMDFFLRQGDRRFSKVYNTVLLSMVLIMEDLNLFVVELIPYFHFSLRIPSFFFSAICGSWVPVHKKYTYNSRSIFSQKSIPLIRCRSFSYDRSCDNMYFQYSQNTGIKFSHIFRVVKVVRTSGIILWIDELLRLSM